MAEEGGGTWRSRLSGSADRRGVQLAPIVLGTLVVIGLLDLNAGLLVGLWVLRKILLYVVVAFFFALLLTPPTRFLKRRGMSHGGATTMVFLIGLIAFGGLVYLFASPLVTAAVHFGHEIPNLVKSTRQGRGPLGRLVFRLHLQKYLSEGSSQITKQVTNVLKPATAFSVGAAALSSLVTVATIAVLTLFAMLEAPRLWRGLLNLFTPATSLRLERVIN
jgi:predicted PurR-regulated permease PerM